MKNISTSWVLVIIFTILSLFACQDNPEDEVLPDKKDDDEKIIDDDPPPSGNQLDPDKLTGSLKFENASVITGNFPAASGTADFKLDTDTIFWVEGIKKRIRVRIPDTFSGGVSALLVHVKEAQDYLSVQPDETESSDSIAVFYFDFDPVDWDLPQTDQPNKAVQDETGDVVDDFPDRPVGIELPGQFDCGPVGDRWDWTHTTVNGELNVAEGYPVITPGTVSGCCGPDGTSYYADCTGTTSEATVNYEAFYMINHEIVKFFEEGDLAGELREQTRNVAPSESDFCAGTAGYREGIMHNTFTGNFTFNSSTGKIDLSNIEGEKEVVEIAPGVTYEVTKPLYFGNFNQVEMISCHFLVDRSSVEGMNVERIFERRSEFLLWYD
jgi:hypothetical protein